MTFAVRAIGAALAYIVIYGAALAWLAQAPGFEAGEALGGMLIFGLLFSGIAWAATRGISAPVLEVRQPARESAAIVLYLAFFALAVLGWLFTWVKATAPDGKLEESAMLLVKLTTMVALPAWLFMQLGQGDRTYRWRELFRFAPFDRKLWRVFLIMAALLLALQFIAGQGPKHIAALSQPAWIVVLATPIVMVWMTLEAGLTEEFLFRVLLQTRLAAWLKSDTAAIVGMALLFGLAHAPGYVLRGGHIMEAMPGPPDALTAIAYSIAVVSPIGIMFGVLWARTRSLLLVVLLHGWTDLVPNLAPFVRTWLA